MEAGRAAEPVRRNRYEEQKRKGGEALLRKVGDTPAVRRFLRYGKVSSWYSALFHVNRYLTWLREIKGAPLSTDELITDNLRCVYESGPVDVVRKRRHTDWLDEFVNDYLVKKGVVDQSRLTSASFVKLLYRRNDSPLFGNFSVTLQRAIPPPPPLPAEDVRAVLKALPLAQRVPLLLMWQSGTEINRVLSLIWGDLAGISSGEYPLKLAFVGRKRHRRPYHTYLGRDSIDSPKAEICFMGIVISD
jgi:integrase